MHTLPLTFDELRALPHGSIVRIHDAYSGREIDYLATSATPGWRWLSQPAERICDEAGLVGATLVSTPAQPYGQSYAMSPAGMTRAFYPPGAYAPSHITPIPAPPKASAPPRALVPGLKSPTEEECALLPEGSIICEDGNAYEKIGSDQEPWECGSEGYLDSDFDGANAVVLRVGDGTQPGAYLPPSASVDDVIGMLFERQDLRDALAARVPGLQALAEAIKALQGEVE